MDNLRIMPEKSNCTSLVDDEVMEGQVCRGRSRRFARWRSRWTMPGWGDLFGPELANKKKRWRTCCATRGAKNDPGGEKPL